MVLNNVVVIIVLFFHGINIMIVLGIFIVFANAILILTRYKNLFFNIFFLDTAKTSKGFISLKAFRLTPEAIKMFKEGDFSPEYVKVGFQYISCIQFFMEWNQRFHLKLYLMF